jgi:hypothetical protein
MQRFDQRLECSDCNTIYLDIPDYAVSQTLVHCSTCHKVLGSWGELEANFAQQGGENGIFEMYDGQIFKWS